MAKKALFDVLERTIGKYVLNLDAESLNVAVWSGKIELKSLELDIRAVNNEIRRRAIEAPNLALPFRVTSGQFASFQVDVPWANLTGKPVILRARGLSVSVEPFDHLASADVFREEDDNEAIMAARIQSQREVSLLNAEVYRQQAVALHKLAEEDLDDTVSSKNSSFGARLVRRIIENLQVEIEDVHLSLEGSGCSAGIILEFFQLVTTDRLGNRTFVDRTAGKDKDSSFLHKALEIRGLGLYMDEDSSGRSMGAIQEDDGAPSHAFIVAPLSFDAKLRQADSAVCRDYPKYFLESQFHGLSIILSKNQLELIRRIQEQLRPPEGYFLPLFPEYRPLSRPSPGTAQSWWRYAYRCIGRLNGKQGWRNFISAFQMRKKYIALYKRKAFADSCPWLMSLNPKEEADLLHIEQDRTISVEGIMTWRTIASGQVDKERVKYDTTAVATRTQKSLFQSLFGSPAGATDLASENADIPPISLSAEEMQQLESIVMDRMADDELSSDSRLCDVKFVLGSLDIQLTMADSRPLTGLEMGTVAASFRASVDGSYSFDCSMASLMITDRVTPQTCFPNILQNVVGEDGEGDVEDAFHAHLSRTKSGDQTVRLHLSTFVAVTSSKLIIALREFWADERSVITRRIVAQNPLLAQSMSGSVDIFYDACEGGDTPGSFVHFERNRFHEPTAGFDPSQALISAWKSKTENKAAWILSMDIHAPIIIVPERCTDLQANVLVFNLGRFQFSYGTNNNPTALTEKVTRWFEDNQRQSIAERIALNYGTLTLTNLTFSVGKAHQIQDFTYTAGRKDESGPAAIFEPMSLETAFAIETADMESIPRACLSGVIPSIGLNTSADHISRVMSVMKAYNQLTEVLSKTDTFPVEQADDSSHASSKSRSVGSFLQPTRELLDSVASPNRGGILSYHLELNLQRLSLTVMADDHGSGLEANLVSVIASVAGSEQGSVSRLTMGWFWVYDRLQYNIARNQRLLVHSKLPLDTKGLADQANNIMGLLTKFGAFRNDFSRSSELADVQYRVNSSQSQRVSAFGTLVDEKLYEKFDRVLEARFTTLNINWNPQVMKLILATARNITSFSNDLDTDLLLPMNNQDRNFEDIGLQATARDTLRVDLSMDRLQVCLHSAKDDLPLFSLTMSNSVCACTRDAQNMSVSFTVDDLTVQTPKSEKILPTYQTILGLSPGLVQSLVTVKYYDGKDSLKLAEVEGFKVDGYETFASVSLSSMRFVYLHSQVLSLVEYATEGILGVVSAIPRVPPASADLTACIPSNPSFEQEATDISSAKPLKKLFRIKATGFDMLLPEAAYTHHYLSLMTNELLIDYCSEPAPGIGRACLALSNVAIVDSEGNRLLTVKSEIESRQSAEDELSNSLLDIHDRLPTGYSSSDKAKLMHSARTDGAHGNADDLSIHDDRRPVEFKCNAYCLLIEACLPPVGVGTQDDQAIRVKLELSEAPFVLSKIHYAQILRTLASNIGEVDLFLRNNEGSNALEATHVVLDSSEIEISHSGVPVLEVSRRLYFDCYFRSLSLLLVQSNEEEAIVCISAVQGKVSMKLLVDLESILAEATLKDLACSDERIASIGRQQRSLVYQESNKGSQDVFHIRYESDSKGDTCIHLLMGSPRLVFIPDAVSDVLAFFGSDRPYESDDQGGGTVGAKLTPEVFTSCPAAFAVEVNAFNEQEEVETSIIKPPQSTMKTNKTYVEIKTDRCSLLLVDLGSSDLLPAASLLSPKSASSLAELVVFEGEFETKITVVSESLSGQTTFMDCEFQAQSFEAYTAYGSALENPLQVLEPAQITLAASLESVGQDSTTVSLRVASTTALDIIISMRNVALCNAILNSVTDCFRDHRPTPDVDAMIGEAILTPNQAAQIEVLSSALACDCEVAGSVSPPASRTQEKQLIESAARSSKRHNISVKVTVSQGTLTCINDLQGIDEALLRITLNNLICAGQVNEGVSITGSQAVYSAFHLTLHTSVLADYFDSSANLWKSLTIVPWEVACKAVRGTSNRFSSTRPSTTIDLESFPLHLSFSEQFLMAIASATHMWRIYKSAMESAVESNSDETADSMRRRSLAASAARALIKSLPYAIENHCGKDIEFSVDGPRLQTVSHGTMEYFRFEPPKGSGRGGRRVYGQDVKHEKCIALKSGESSIILRDIDQHSNFSSRAYDLDGYLILCTASRENKTMVFHISSGVEIVNQTLLSFHLAIRLGSQDHELGVCWSQGIASSSSRQNDVKLHQNGRFVKASPYFGVPVDCLKEDRLLWEKSGISKLSLVVSPNSGPSQKLLGVVTFRVDSNQSESLESKIIRQDVICSNPKQETTDSYCDPFALCITSTMQLINGYPCHNISIEPRATIINRIPVPIQIRTPMPQTHSVTHHVTDEGNFVLHDLQCGSKMEIFTAGPSIAVTIRCKDLPVAGTSTDWMEGWVDLPLVPEFRLLDPLNCYFPLSRHVADPLGIARTLGCHFLIAEREDNISSSERLPKGLETTSRSGVNQELCFAVTVFNYAVDHTGEILFENLSPATGDKFRRSTSNTASARERHNRPSRYLTAPLGAYSTKHRGHRITLLPESHVPIRVLHLTMEGEEGIQKGSSICVDDIAICEGGALSTPLTWEDGQQSGYFAYRQLVNSYQSEVHIIPECILFNGSSDHPVRIKQTGGRDSHVAPRHIAPLTLSSAGAETSILLQYDFGARTPPIRVDVLGIRIAVLKSFRGDPIGSVALQTVVGGLDSRLVVKLGEVKLGSAAVADSRSAFPLALDNDFLRLRFQCSELSVTLEKSKACVDDKHAFMESALDRLRKRSTPSASKALEEKSWMRTRSRHDAGGENDPNATEPVCTVRIHRCTIDWQRVFKEDENKSRPMGMKDVLGSLERSQLSVIIHNVQIRDETPGSPFPVVFDSTSNVSFLDLCVRFRGSFDSQLVKVDLFDLNLAHKNGISQAIVISTSEDFVWSLLDLANRIMMAAAEFAGVDIELRWDADHDGYLVVVTNKETSTVDEANAYTPPKADTLYDFNHVRVSPFLVQLSFKRVPQSSRYKILSGFRGANIMNYFTTRLKFKIDQAELKFSRFETRNVRGPPDHLVEMLSTVYVSRMKLKFVSIMTAATFQDWKTLASRDSGDDEFVEGDILRVAGNIAGNSVNYVLRKAGIKLGQGISTVTHAIGDGIENATSAIGARAVGAGVNSLVSGVGDGVGDALSGVGTGAGKVVRGVGKGVGQVFGGLSGGAVMVGKGIGKGLIEGDGRAIATGLTEGATSVGTGVGQGIETLVHGTASGVYSVGSGLFSGVRTIGQGIGGALTAICTSSCCCANVGEDDANNPSNALVTPLLTDSSNIV